MCIPSGFRRTKHGHDYGPASTPCESVPLPGPSILSSSSLVPGVPCHASENDKSLLHVTISYFLCSPRTQLIPLFTEIIPRPNRVLLLLKDGLPLYTLSQMWLLMLSAYSDFIFSSSGRWLISTRALTKDTLRNGTLKFVPPFSILPYASCCLLTPSQLEKNGRPLIPAFAFSGLAFFLGESALIPDSEDVRGSVLSLPAWL